MASATILPPSSGAENPARPPWNLPMGVRTAERMTGVSVVMVSLQRRAGTIIARCDEGGCRPGQIILGSMSRSFGRARLAFIRAWTVEPRHRNSDEPEVNRELRAMMDEMVEAHSANARDTRHGEDLLATGQQFPTFRHVGVTDFGE